MAQRDATIEIDEALTAREHARERARTRARTRAQAGEQTEAPARGRLRLTTRGRRALLAILVLPALIALGVALSQVPEVSAADASIEAEGVAAFEYRTVHPGDTLWEIAAETAQGRDVRDVILEIERLNGLDGAPLQPGQRIALPRD